MTDHAAFRVPGENTGWLVPCLLAAAGALCASLATLRLSESLPVVTHAAMSSEPAPPHTSSAGVPRPSAPSQPAPTPLEAAPTPSRPPPPTPIAACTALELSFGPASAILSRQATTDLETLAGWLASHADANLLIEGHADGRGDERSNVELSYRRAQSCARLLQKLGVARTRLTLRGFGTYQPVEGRSDDDPANRRVTLRARGDTTCPELVARGDIP